MIQLFFDITKKKIQKTPYTKYWWMYLVGFSLIVSYINFKKIQ